MLLVFLSLNRGRQFSTRVENWKRDYNKILQGSGVTVTRVKVDPRFPRERILTLQSHLDETETRKAVSLFFTRNSQQEYTKFFKEKEYQEVVIPGVLVPAGRITSTQPYETVGRLKELNKDLQLGLRYPTYLASLHQKINQAPLRICLTSSPNNENPLPKIKVDTVEGVKEVQALPYRQSRKYEEGKYLDEDGYLVTHQHPNRPRYQPGAWGPPGVAGHLEVKCVECGKVHHGTCVTCKDYGKHHPGQCRTHTMVNTCFICKREGHWRSNCPQRVI